MEFSAKQIAEILEGSVEGNEEVKVNTLSKIEEGTAGSLTFLANPKYKKFIYTTKASICIVNKDFVPEHEIGCTLVKVQDAYGAFAKLLEAYQQIREQKSGVSDKASIAKSAKIGENVSKDSTLSYSNVNSYSC